jgi:hypothetical protein
MWRVVQTKEAFRYPVGKVWGPYLEEVDAHQRVATLRWKDGDGVIEEGEFGDPVMAVRPAGEGGPSAAREEERELAYA